MSVVITKNWNTDLNYWEMNPIMKSIPEFKMLYASDKTKDKRKSSVIMWAIAMLCDPNDQNPWRNTVEEEKKAIIATETIGDPKFQWDEPHIIELVEAYEEKCLSIAEKELTKLLKKLTQRAVFIDSTNYSLDSYDDVGKPLKGTADQLDKMLINTGKIYSLFQEIQDKLNQEQASGALKGGATESASEQGKL